MPPCCVIAGSTRPYGGHLRFASVKAPYFRHEVPYSGGRAKQPNVGVDPGHTAERGTACDFNRNPDCLCGGADSRSAPRSRHCGRNEGTRLAGWVRLVDVRGHLVDRRVQTRPTGVMVGPPSIRPAQNGASRRSLRRKPLHLNGRFSGRAAAVCAPVDFQNGLLREVLVNVVDEHVPRHADVARLSDLLRASTDDDGTARDEAECRRRDSNPPTRGL